MRTIAIIPAAGAGKRLKSHIAKQYLLLDGKPVLVHTLEIFQKSKEIDEIIIALPLEDLVYVRQDLVEKYGLTKVTNVVAGGKERQDSIRNCLLAIEGKCNLVVIHDAVRPFITEVLLKQVIDAAKKIGAALAGIKAKDTIKEIKEGNIIAATVPRNNLWMAQTPQVFDYKLIKQAYEKAYDEKYYGTDDASLVERMGREVIMVESSYKNIKITNNEDMLIAEALMRIRNKVILRSGIGYDSHRFTAGRKLILGGVEIPCDKGLDGHSDADVLIHAICDSVLGASGLKDIGRHFPDNDPEFKDISSMIILEKVNEIISAEGFSINNIDATVIMEKPKLAPHTAKMVSNLARILHIPENCVSIKAKTNEGMGFIGRNEGVAVFATAMLTERKKNDSQA